MASWLADEAQKFVDQTQAYVTCLINGPATTESESQTETDAAPAYATDKSWWLANPALGVVGSELWVPMQTVPPTTVECAPVAGSPAADVFFVHGTLASPQDGPRGDGNYDCRASLPDATKGYVLSQAACFNAVARIFAPHYRYAAFVAEGERASTSAAPRLRSRTLELRRGARGRAHGRRVALRRIPPLTALPGLDAAGEGTHLGCFGWGAFFVQVFYTEACAKVAVKDGLLRIVGDKNALAYYATGTGCMHKWDFHLLWLDVRKNAVAQLANYEKETAAA
ncbi:hypothetical protein JL722_5267 [Aureococcus anophagefferens]|nr:hypothetical protein JL722_5267 [Aureococcus anophagefferens]